MASPNRLAFFLWSKGLQKAPFFANISNRRKSIVFTGGGMSAVHIDFVVLCCIDPRYRYACELFVREKYGISPDEYDIKTDAGAVREIALGTGAGEWILYNLIDVAVSRHGARTVILCNHVDCSHYGGTAALGGLEPELARYRDDLATAAAAIRSRFSGVKIDAYIGSKKEGAYDFNRVPLEITDRA
jgi:hypothetical protein